MAKRVKCKLCKVKRKEWEEELFFGVRCNKHFVPMIILKEHKKKLNKEEKENLKLIMKKYHPEMFPDKSLSDSDDHWHLHLTKKNKGIDI